MLKPNSGLFALWENAHHLNSNDICNDRIKNLELLMFRCDWYVICILYIALHNPHQRINLLRSLIKMIYFLVM